jgi:hypothetical protein
MNHVPPEIAATGFELPEGYLHACRLGLGNLAPWRFLKGEAFLSAYDRVNAACEGRILLPFARRDDCGEVACFEVLPGPAEAVHVISSGEAVAEFASFWEFVRQAVDDMIQAAPDAPTLDANDPALTWEWFRRRAASAVDLTFARA